MIATSNLGIDDSTYAQLKAPIHAKSIKLTLFRIKCFSFVSNLGNFI